MGIDGVRSQVGQGEEVSDGGDVADLTATDSIISSESYKKLVNISQRDRKSLGPVLIHIPLIVVTGLSLVSTADCVCFKRHHPTCLREVEANNGQVSSHTETFYATAGKMC